MAWLTVLGGFLAGWALLAIMGGERERRRLELEVRLRQAEGEPRDPPEPNAANSR